MASRGSFVTEYVYCNACGDALWEALKGHAYACRLPGMDGTIIAGQLRASSEIEAVLRLRSDLSRTTVCHPCRVAVVGESAWSATLLVHEGGVSLASFAAHSIEAAAIHSALVE